MTELEQGNQQPRRAGIVFVAFCIFIAFLLVVCYIIESLPDNEYKLADSDCYMHLIRASDLYHQGQWYNPVWIKSNAPYGEPLHWSRPFDVLLLAGAIPGSVLVDFETALFWWGVVLSPILLVFALIALHWTARVVLSKNGTFLVIFIFLSQAMVSTYFQAGRPDHHSLLALFFILHVGFVLWVISKPFKRSLCYWAGAVSAMAIWISVESVVPVCVTIGALGLLWALGNGDMLKKSLNFTLALFVFCCLFLMLERPLPDLGLVKYDSISIVYITVLGLITLFWIVAWVLSGTSHALNMKVSRLVYDLLGGGVVALTTRVLFPKLYHGPFADVDPRIMKIFFNRTIEVQPFTDKSVSLGISVQLIGSAIISFGFLMYLLFQQKDTKYRIIWRYMLISGVLLVSMALYQIRWAIYPYVILSLVMTALLCRLRKDEEAPGPVCWKTIYNISITLIFMFGLLGGGLVADEMLGKSVLGESSQEPPMNGMYRFLNELSSDKEHPPSILANPFDGAEILYRTDCHVVSTANTYGQGLLDTYDIMTAETDEAAYRILEKRRIDLILVCPNSNEPNVYSKPGATSIFFQRLCEGRIPDWLEGVTMPEQLSEDFLLFEVSYDSASKEEDEMLHG